MTDFNEFIQELLEVRFGKSIQPDDLGYYSLDDLYELAVSNSDGIEQCTPSVYLQTKSAAILIEQYANLYNGSPVVIEFRHNGVGDYSTLSIFAFTMMYARAISNGFKSDFDYLSEGWANHGEDELNRRVQVLRHVFKQDALEKANKVVQDAIAKAQHGALNHE